MHCLHFLQTLLVQERKEHKRVVLLLVVHSPMFRRPLWHHVRGAGVGVRVSGVGVGAGAGVGFGVGVGTGFSI